MKKYKRFERYYSEKKSLETLVFDWLLKNKECRNSDRVLYLSVCTSIDRNVANKRFGDVILNLTEECLPAYETVSRLRRKLQREYPELLSANERTEKARAKTVANYIEWTTRKFNNGRMVKNEK